MNDRKRSRLYTMVFLCWIVLAFCTLIYAGGCSTVEGLGGLMSGAGADIQDAARGTREKMADRR